MRNKKVERHRKPVMGLQPKYMYALISSVIMIFGLIIRHVLLIFGLVFIIGGLFGVWLTVGKDLIINKGRTPLDNAINNIHQFFYNQKLVVDDSSNLNYYNSPVTTVKRGLKLEVYCIPAKRDEMLSDQTLDALQAYIDSYNCGLSVKRSYYDHGFVIYELGHDIESDRLDF